MILRPRRSHPSDENRADDSLPFEVPTSDRAQTCWPRCSPSPGQEPNEDNARIYQRLPSIVDVFVSEFNDWKDWYEVAQKLATDDFKVLSADAASVPLCLPSVVTVDGIESVVVDSSVSTTTDSMPSTVTTDGRHSGTEAASADRTL